MNNERKISNYISVQVIFSKNSDYDKNLAIMIDTKTRLNIENSSRSGCINPIMSYEEVKDSCKVIKDKEDYVIVEFGKSFSSQENEPELERLKNANRLGEIEKTNENYTIFIDKDGNKTQIPVYLDKTTNKKFVFF